MVQTKNKNRNIRRTLLGATAVAGVFALAGCEDNEEAAVFSGVEQCVANKPLDFDPIKAETSWQEICEAQFAAARAAHDMEAPRYDSRSLCESEHGAGNCGSGAEVSSGGGSFFMPFLVGYMIGGGFDSDRGYRGYNSQPLVSSSKGTGYYTTKGTLLSTTTRSFSSPVLVSKSTLTKPAAKTPPKVMTKATVAKTGGFGAAKTSKVGTGGRSSFGG